MDDLTHTPGKTTTTVAMDFGCVTVDPTLKLYLFGTPGQDRFGFMRDDLMEGAPGGLVIVDTRRLEDCYAAVDYFEHRDIPFAVGVNAFDGKVEHDLAEVRWAPDIAEHVPMVVFDARRTGSVRDALLAVLDVAVRRAEAAAASWPVPAAHADERLRAGGDGRDGSLEEADTTRRMAKVTALRFPNSHIYQCT